MCDENVYWYNCMSGSLQQLKRGHWGALYNYDCSMQTRSVQFQGFSDCKTQQLCSVKIVMIDYNDNDENVDDDTETTNDADYGHIDAGRQGLKKTFRGISDFGEYRSTFILGVF